MLHSWWRKLLNQAPLSGQSGRVDRRHRSRSVFRVEELESRFLMSADSAFLQPFPLMQPGASASPVGLIPDQIKRAYGFDKIRLNGGINGDGKGQTIAIISAYDNPQFVSTTDANYGASDLHKFSVAFGIPDPPSFKKLDQNGGLNYPIADPTFNGFWAHETAIDVEWAHALAPAADLILIEATDPSPTNILTSAVSLAKSFPNVTVISMSFGNPEAFSDPTMDNLYLTPVGHAGITFLAATGDTGAFSANSPFFFSPNNPATSPNVLSVGGTTLTVDSLGNWLGETGWGNGNLSYDPFFGGKGGSGGGISQFELQPTYQNGVVTQSNSQRTTPDVSFNADPATGVAVFDSFNNGPSTPWSISGGTSFATPAWAAIIAITNQGMASVGLPSLDGPNPSSGTMAKLYQLPATDFHDITVGNNGYAAGPGYDLVTGRGSPLAQKVVGHLWGNKAPTAAPTTYTINFNGTLTAAVSNGILANATDPEKDQLSAQLITGTTNGVLNLSPDGSFTYTPNPNFTGTDTFKFQVNDPVNQGNQATVTINVTYAPPSAQNVNYLVNTNTVLSTTAANGVLANAIDPEGNPMTAQLVSTTTHGALTLNPDGSFTYTPQTGYVGSDSFVFLVKDAFATGANAIASINVHLPPTAQNSTYTTNSNTKLSRSAANGVLAGATFQAGETLSAFLVNTTTKGTLVLNLNGSFDYTPNQNFFGTDSFTFQVKDTTTTGNLATATITVNNLPPTGSSITYATPIDTALTVSAANGVLSTASDQENEALTAVLVTTVTQGTLTLNPNGSFNYAPNTGFAGTDTFTFRVVDPNGTSPVITASIRIDTPPVASNMNYFTNSNTPLPISAANGVLSTAFDADGDPMSAVLISQPGNGNVILNLNGSFTYTPKNAFFGTDTFIYQVVTPTLPGNTAVITISVANQPPITQNKSYSVNSNTTLSTTAANGVLTVASDAEGEALFVTIVTTTTHGSLTLNADGSFSYSPALNYFGPDSFTYTVGDASASGNSATVSINVLHQAPVALDTTFSTSTGVALIRSAAQGVLAPGSATDPQGQPMTVSLLSATTNGILTLNPNGSFSYTPAAGFTGTDTFTYQVSDPIAVGNTATATITVANQPPVANNFSYTTRQNTTLAVTAANGVLAHASDAEGETMTAVLVSTTSNGVLALKPDGSFTYTPNNNFTGSDSFKYQASDPNGTSTPATITLVVDQPPVAVNDAYTVSINQKLITTAANGVLANDTDKENEKLSATLVAPPLRGTLVLSADGSFTYTPANNFLGIDSFTYLVSDPTATGNQATVTITILNQPPVAKDSSYSTSANRTLVVTAANGVLATASDAENEPMSATVVSQPTHGTVSLNADGSFTYIPNGTFFGTDSFTFRVSDTSAPGNIATASITIANQPPVAQNSSYVFNSGIPLNVDAAHGVLANASDPQGLPMTATVVSLPRNGTLFLQADGSFSFVPNSGFLGTDSFTFRVSDASLQGNIATVTLQGVLPPVAQDSNYIVNSNTTLTVSAAQGVLAAASDLQGLPMTAALVTAPVNGSVTLKSDGSFVYSPRANFFGVDSFAFRVSDPSIAGNIATATISVLNLAPTANNIAYHVNAHSTLTVSAAKGVLSAASDSEQEVLTATLLSGPSHGALTFNVDGSFVYTPTGTFVGTDTFQYQVGDASAAGNTATVSILVIQSDIVATGADAGGGPNVVVYNGPSQAIKFNFFAYDPAFVGGVRVAVGDVTGDGTPDIVTGPGPGGGPDVHVYDGNTGGLIRQFFAFDPRFAGGVFVAAGDVNGDGRADIVIGADTTGGPNVIVFDGKTNAIIQNFFAFDPTFGGGARVAVGDVEGIGRADIIVGAGPGGAPNVRAFSGISGQPIGGFFGSFMAFDPNFVGGVYVAAGDVNGDGLAEIIAGAGAGGGPAVSVFDRNGSMLSSFFAYSLDNAFSQTPGIGPFVSGVRVGAVDLDGDGSVEVVTIPGAGRGSLLRAFKPLSATIVDNFFAYNPSFRAGAFIGGSN